jgi:hypothetical protein
MHDGAPFLKQIVYRDLVLADIVKKDMEGKVVLVLRVNPIRDIPGTFATTALVHHGECILNPAAVHTLPSAIDHTNDATHI